MRYFSLHDNVKSGNLKVEYCPSGDKYANYMSKPLQGSLFLKFRRDILGM